MKKFDPIIEKYKNKGVSAENIEYAIDSVKDGTKRELILENLTADYRGMNAGDATRLLEELFVANGGEFKKENRGGYFTGAFLLLIGLACGYYIFHVFTYGGVLIRPILVSLLAILGTLGGIASIILALLGAYREDDDLSDE
ncbi:hypothetical protein [Chitinophaga filiformis]|uniref:Uncharacterized protein n=1 Tax=Chitinophaga filiformis TaxID=104663 RepID=A0A1G8BRY2_CHIFI|nr:hypothetical protein [Chitinophaga filiformis]SDH35460.1 hypothetical protein SAMN04488121_111125 [Chitinophaga filiformis]